MKIFVSYTLRDQAIDLSELRRGREVLSRVGETFVDVLDNRSTDPQGFVLEMLEQATAFCAVITPAFFDSPWVRVECQSARLRRLPMTALLVPDAECVGEQWQRAALELGSGRSGFWSLAGCSLGVRLRQGEANLTGLVTWTMGNSEMLLLGRGNLTRNHYDVTSLFSRLRKVGGQLERA